MTSADRATVLTVTYGGSHSYLMAPAVWELRHRGRVDVVSLALTTGVSAYRELGLETRGYHDYLDPVRDANAVALGERLVTDVDYNAVGVARDESVAYMGLCMDDLVQEVGEHEAWERYERLGRHAFLPRRTLRRIIERERPAVIAVTNSPKSERAAVLEGNDAGIPTLIIPDHFAIRNDQTYSPFEARWFAAMCDITRDQLIAQHGAVPERIVVTGQPAFEKTRVPDLDRCRAYARSVIQPPPERPYVLVATGPDAGVCSGKAPASRAHSSRVVSLLMTIAHTQPDLGFVIKPHPNESEQLYHDIVNAHPQFSMAPAGSDTDMLLRASKGMVAAVSTSTVLHALALDVPVMVLNLSDRPDTWPYAELQVPVVTSATALEGGLDAFLHDPELARLQADSRRRFRQMNHHAAAKLADLIEGLAYEAR